MRLFINQNFSLGVMAIPFMEFQVWGYKIFVGLDQTGYMSFLTGQDRTPKFAGQVLPDRTKSGLTFLNIYSINCNENVRPNVTRFKIGHDRTGHMSFLTGQDRTPKFAG